ncbi:hypothetical protein BKH43_07475 [Helicobacter sp. 13S00401-1]|uniref:ImmA/IrrE family metallo-endopeptidase n=1 Tax=Helicobacter sp. 13S00401-1 TaxID=1905758 RepID=UPI000BA61C62|nr:ImmA/IrrE family metallo-endopeptidase [Helicobacter sp. 13S00401-1]PAF49025.1 hypothetical protein BKH43_07475 [Helicobacter sp. 13S00401-1]
MVKTVEINPKRIEYLLDLFNLNLRELANLIDMPTQSLLQQDTLKLSTLKKIDKIFKKGLNFYTEPTNLSKKENILFRVKNKNLTISDKQLILNKQDDSNYIQSILKLTNFKLERKLDIKANLKSKPSEIASLISPLVLPKDTKDDKRFLKNFIAKLAALNILVFEILQPPNKKDKSKIDAFFIKPNFIFLNRQKGFKRELFTLAHELGHYILHNEHIDDDIFETLSKEESWCNEFAFYLLAGKGIEEILSLKASELNFYNEKLQSLSNKYHISTLAIFCFLAKRKVITWQHFFSLKQQSDELVQLPRIKEIEFFAKPKPICSPLQKDIFKIAYLKGIVSEKEILLRFAKEIKNHNLESFIYSAI